MRPGILALGLVAASLTIPPPALTGQALPQRSGDVLRTPAGAFTSSLVVPGAGQAALGLRRWPVYVALEAGFWWFWADARGEFRGFRDGYRDLAWEAARIPDGARRDGDWSYYEAMSAYLASGAFDLDAAEGVQPETDPTTWNGTVWEIARGLHLPGGVPPDPDSPEYARALDWYVGRAAGPGFLWSWAGAEVELDRFRRLIRSADDARRSQTLALGLILANHLVSAVDALIMARMAEPARPELRGRIVPGPTGPAWQLEIRVPLTN